MKPAESVPVRETTARKDYITVTRGLRGYFAVHVWWNPEHGGFYEPWQSGVGSYDSAKDAAVEAQQWAEAEGLEYIP